MAVDDDEDSPEAAAARKQARKDRRETNRLKREGMGGSAANSPADSRDSSEEPEPTPKKVKGRKTGKADKRKAEDADDEPPAKRKRGGPSRPKAPALNGDGLTVKQRNILQASLRSIYESLMNLESNSDSGSDDDDEDEDQGKRLIIGPFVALPPKRDFPDYFMIIKDPISMKMIEKKIKKEEYPGLADFKKDIQHLCSNAKTYNEDGSMIYVDAVAIEVRLLACI